jgi:hypothetical protein
MPKNKRESAQHYRKLIDRLFRVKSIRYAVITDELGIRYFGGMKEGVESTTPLDIEKRLEVQAVLILKMAVGYERFDGKLLYSCIQWQDVSAYFFLLGRRGNRILTITIDSVGLPLALTKARRVVENWNSR